MASVLEGGQVAPGGQRTSRSVRAGADCDPANHLGDADQRAEADRRRDLLLELYEQGLTRSEIAERMGICADWVRQLLKRHEVPLVPVWERRYRRAIAGRESQVIAAFMRLRDYRDVARQLGLREAHVQRLLNSAVPEAGVLGRTRRTLGRTYTDGELLDALRSAALDAPSPMSIESYRLWAQRAGADQRRPGPEVFKLRFCSWRQALAQADLPTNSRSGPQASYRYEDVVAAVAAAWRELGSYPSVTRYDAWRAGRAQLPVAATARRLVRSWDDLLVAAHPLVYPSVDSGKIGPRALDGALPD
jgi:hypothetical protein